MMDAIDSIDPYSRPARRTQWIVSTLAYHYGLDRGVENEIIVLATGLDQYLQEIFHHMDYQGGGKIPVEDFNILCEVLGLNKDSEECAGVLDHLPSELTFRHFHAKLCGYFSTKAGCQYENGRLLVGKDSEHIETQIRLRSPLRRREKLLSVGPSTEGRHASGCRLGSCTKECYEEIVALEEAEDRISKLEDENASLRELIEDMRAALQSSDARCLALQVGLWKSHSKHKPEEGCFVAHQKQAGQKNMSSASLKSSTYSNLKSLQNIIHEIELLRSSRDRQVEEAMLCNQRLEQELWSSKETVAALEDCNQALKREQVTMRRKVEEARQALLSGLGKVKELETKASHVPALQRHILQLESELLYYRSEVSKLQLPSSTRTEQQMSVGSRPGQRCCSDSQHDRCSPTGRAVTTPDKMEEQLFRSVEGQAASDEEEDKWTGDQQRQVDEVKRILTRLSCCGERCDDKAFKKLMSNFGSSRSEESCSAVVELLERVTRLHKQLELKESQAEIDMDQMKDSLVQELQQKAEETELLQMELQMLETERVRLSLVEEKLVDILQLLQQLRDLNVSRRSLGKILLSTLESCSDPQHGKAHILEVLNALYHELAACEILSTGGPLERTQSQQSLNALVITC
ncbi:EF-hand and coiled-coil domain-containing protein 1 Coiled-coil domain-containing protein 48 [Larimichthys crocea]|uniref:EF-hand and coiled-coil domain-containing protein 1 Coiled-coil domain-containing protein 48 n=2 Tax=Larimichthys crocea TaxID=215358 RepID=A0A6G0J2G1_LARCR|nr:EF-hand and coiled-coil domain-containing protein 1 [Larimichthys crocea]KAE8297890.1 EF-hand and coiled-coil domain-containing protein 1 Coiled-coil domain-containing protein 48 [Larimichthys crocea]TMS18960.1 EF-hand and coiled-coil domain-containing protein 1 [Larimichthys crocea]